jgi:general secretion pathway protein A
MYTSYFGFREKPFNVTPNPRFFYANREYEEAYANLLYGIRERKGFLLLTGEVGTGKTTILQRLMEELEPTVRFVFFYNTNLTFDELLTFVCDELGLTVEVSGQLSKIRALNAFLLDQLSKGSTAVLFIDEAQNLRGEVLENLRLLSNLETPREKLLQIVLSGQPELEAKVDKTELRQLKQRIFSHSRLGPLNEDEVGAFIDYRLKAADYRGNNLFPRDTVREIARYSKGTPRLINIICDNALLITYAKSQKKISPEVISEVASDLRLDSKLQNFSAKASAVKIPRDGNASNGDHASLVWQKAGTLTKHTNPTMYVNGKSGSITTPMPSLVESTGEVATTSFLDALTIALTGAMGPMAPLVIREHLGAIDHSTNLSRQCAEQLVESVSSEVLDDLLKISFKSKMAQVAAALATK